MISFQRSLTSSARWSDKAQSLVILRRRRFSRISPSKVDLYKQHCRRWINMLIALFVIHYHIFQYNFQMIAEAPWTTKFRKIPSHIKNHSKDHALFLDLLSDIQNHQYIFLFSSVNFTNDCWNFIKKSVNLLKCYGIKWLLTALKPVGSKENITYRIKILEMINHIFSFWTLCK